MKSTEQATIEEVSWVMDVNFMGVVRCTQAVLPHMRRAKAGHIINITSVGGLVGQPFNEFYCGAKFAVEGLTQILADEYEHAGRIRVNSLNPGGTRTAMRRSAYPAEDPASVPAPEAHMDLYLYLFSDASIGITGQQFDARDWHP